MATFYERYWSDAPQGHLGDFSYKWPAVVPLLPRQAGIRYLDYGCGRGALLGEFLKLNPEARCSGLDVSSAALTAARAAFPTVRFELITDGAQVPLADASQDFIFCSEVIEHIYDTENAFFEMARVLAPGGQLVLTTPYHGVVKNVLIALTCFDRHFDPTGPHVRFFTTKSLAKCLHRVGFQVQRTSYAGRFWPIPKALIVLARKP